MRLICHLRDFRGERTIAAVAAQSGVGQADLSRIERGVMLPTDGQIATLERAIAGEMTVGELRTRVRAGLTELARGYA